MMITTVKSLGRILIGMKWIIVHNDAPVGQSYSKRQTETHKNIRNNENIHCYLFTLLCLLSNHSCILSFFFLFYVINNTVYLWLHMCLYFGTTNNEGRQLDNNTGILRRPETRAKQKSSHPRVAFNWTTHVLALVHVGVENLRLIVTK